MKFFSHLPMVFAAILKRIDHRSLAGLVSEDSEEKRDLLQIEHLIELLHE